MPPGGPSGPLPDGFDEMLAAVLAPGQAAAAARAVGAAARFDDERLARFLEELAELVGRSRAPLTAADLQALLKG